MLELERALASKLAKMRVRIDVPNDDTVVFHNVPANKRFFNKAHTNLLLKRPRAGTPFFVCVDEDLEYLGPDSALTRVFGGGIMQRGWRTLRVEYRLATDLHEATENALAALGFDGQEPALAPPHPRDIAHSSGGLLANAGTNLSQLINDSKAEPTIGRVEATDEVASGVLRWGQTRLALIVGESGVGKTNLLHAVARRMSQCRGRLELISLDLGEVLAGTLFDAERENLLSALLNETAALPDTVLALEHLELALSVAHGPLLLAQYADKGVRIIGTTLPKYLSGFQETPTLARRLNVVELDELSPGETVSVLRTVGESIANHHQVEIGESCIGGCVQAARSIPGCFPAKAIALLDAAAARAALSEAKMIGPDEIYVAANRFMG